MGYYREQYGASIEPLLRRWCKDDGSFRGEFVRTLFVDYVAQGKWAVDDQAEKWLRECVDEGDLECLHREPTAAQAAFIGMTYSQAAYNKLPPMTPGTVEHHWFRWLRR